MKIRNLNFLLLSVVTISLAGCDENSSDEVATKYTINFNVDGGSKITSIEAEAGNKVSKPTNPTKVGYEFLGWYTEPTFQNKYSFSVMPKKNLELYARWSLNTFVIDYDLDFRAENNPLNPTSYNVTQNDFTLQPASRVGYFFAGWYTDPDYENKITEIKTDSCQDYVLYAKWSDHELVDDYTINYHLDGGVNATNNPEKFNKLDSTIILSSATKEGYSFAGWYSDEELKVSVSTIDTSQLNNVNLYAKWETLVPTYKITYYLDGGSNANNPIRFTENDTGFIELDDPSKGSCTFQGWYTDAEFTKPITQIDCSKKEDIDIYAKWLNGIVEVKYEFDFGIGSDVVLYHVSDTHINAGTKTSDKKAEASWIDSGRYEFASSFGETYEKKNLYKSSTEFFKAAVSYMNSQNPDAVCYSGDLMDYYSVDNYNFINTEIAKTASPYVYAIGNHESPSSNYENMAGIDTVDFTSVDLGEVILACMCDSNKSGDAYYYTENEYNKLKALVDTTTKPIIIVQHVPILTEYNCDSRIEKCGSYYFIDENSCDSASAKVIDLICNEPKIKMVLCGHIHGGTLSYIAPDKPIITCSSGLIGIINKITLH